MPSSKLFNNSDQNYDGKTWKVYGEKNKSHFEPFVNEWTLVYSVIFFESKKKKVVILLLGYKT